MEKIIDLLLNSGQQQIHEIFQGIIFIIFSNVISPWRRALPLI
jgi:hypothetical protein